MDEKFGNSQISQKESHPVVFYQDANSFLMSHICQFHDHVMVMMVWILSVVLYMFLVIFFIPCVDRVFKSSEILEGVWTLIPCLVLVSLAAPSLYTLYLSDEVCDPMFSVKVVGHQWYWSYEYGDFSETSFNSYMIPTSELKPGMFRLLEVDKSLFLPMGVETRLIVTSSDVIHCWTVPSLGVKVDAVPGRLNQIFVNPSKVGKMYGQCSEICGAMHSFMPICVDVVFPGDFLS